MSRMPTTPIQSSNVLIRVFVIERLANANALLTMMVLPASALFALISAVMPESASLKSSWPQMLTEHIPLLGMLRKK